MVFHPTCDEGCCDGVLKWLITIKNKFITLLPCYVYELKSMTLLVDTCQSLLIDGYL